MEDANTLFGSPWLGAMFQGAISGLAFYYTTDLIAMSRPHARENRNQNRRVSGPFEGSRAQTTWAKRRLRNEMRRVKRKDRALYVHYRVVYLSWGGRLPHRGRRGDP